MMVRKKREKETYTHIHEAEGDGQKRVITNGKEKGRRGEKEKRLERRDSRRNQLK